MLISIITMAILAVLLIAAAFKIGREIGREEGFYQEPIYDRFDNLIKEINEEHLDMAIKSIDEIMVVPEEVKKMIRERIEHKFNS